LKILKLRTTSAWQNAGLSAKLNFYPILYAKAVLLLFFLLNLPKATAFASFGSELNYRSIQVRTSPSRGPLAVILKKRNVKMKIIKFIAIVLFNFSCSAQTNLEKFIIDDDGIAVEKPDSTKQYDDVYNANNIIYTNGRKFIYSYYTKIKTKKDF